MGQFWINVRGNKVVEFRRGIIGIADKKLHRRLPHKLAHADHPEALKEGVFGVVALDYEEVLDGVGKRASSPLRAKAHGAQYGLGHIHHFRQRGGRKLVGGHHPILRGVIQHGAVRGHAYRPHGQLLQHRGNPAERTAGRKRKIGTLLDRPRHCVTVATRDTVVAVQQGAVNIARDEARSAGREILHTREFTSGLRSLGPRPHYPPSPRNV